MLFPARSSPEMAIVVSRSRSFLPSRGAGLLRRAVESVRREVATASAKRLWRWWSPEKQVRENPNWVRDVDLAIIVRIGGIGANQRTAEEQGPEERDRIGEIHLAVPVDLSAHEGKVSRTRDVLSSGGAGRIVGIAAGITFVLVQMTVAVAVHADSFLCAERDHGEREFPTRCGSGQQIMERKCLRCAIRLK